MLTHWDRTQLQIPSRLGAVGLLALMTCAGSALAAVAPETGASGAAGDVQGGGNDTIERARMMRVPSGKGLRTQFEVATPKAYSSLARMTGGFKGPLSASAPVYELYGEVILIGESREQAAAAIGTLGADFAWLTPAMLVESVNLPGVFTIGTRSVESAVLVAGLLSERADLRDVYVNYTEPKGPRSVRGAPDPALGAQWHIENAITPTNDHEIQAVHDSGITGAGVTVGVLEANGGSITSPYDPDNLSVPGYDFSDVVHPDLFANLDLSLSQVTDPFQIDVTHATSVSGLIGATANAGFGRGVAYGSMLAALRNGSDLENAEAWNHKLNDIDIINNSWGPGNDFFTPAPNFFFAIGPDDFEVSFPGARRVPMSTNQELALDRAGKLGRGRKGRPNVLSAGNASHFQGFTRFSVGNAAGLPKLGPLDWLGTTNGDITDFDLVLDPMTPDPNRQDYFYSGMLGDRTEYWQVASHPATFAIAAVGEDNLRAGYSTTGTAVLAAAYSEDAVLSEAFSIMGYGSTASLRGIATTNQIGAGADGDCPGALAALDGLTCTFNGTSAAAPIATGVFALMLEANPNLRIRDIEHIIKETSTQINFNPVGGYWTNLLGYGNPDVDDPNTGNPLFWQANSGDVLHSDEYGFGLINAQAAVAMAATWRGVPRLRILDTGVIESELEIPDATFEEVGDITTVVTEPRILFNLVPGDRVQAGRTLDSGVVLNSMACVRDNLSVEAVYVTITVEGIGAGDLFVVLESPNGSVSPLAVPRMDSSGLENGGFAYASYTFKTYKHWGELSGGQWRLYLQDFRPDEATPEGELPDEGDPMDPTDDDPGEEHVTYFGALGMPGGEFFEHDEKSLVSFRLEIYGSETGLPPTLACPPVLTSCPGDLNGNGIVTFEDLAIFLFWYNTGDPLADINGDGLVTFEDIQAFLGLWQPGFCNSGTLGRPDPNVIGDDPIIRPI